MNLKKLNLSLKSFQNYIAKEASAQVVKRYNDSTILILSIDYDLITATVQGSSKYTVGIELSDYQIKEAYCTCPYAGYGICKHIVNVLVAADKEIKNKGIQSSIIKSTLAKPSIKLKKTDAGFILSGKKIVELEKDDIKDIFSGKTNRERLTGVIMSKSDIEPNKLVGYFNQHYSYKLDSATIIQEKENAILSCTCYNSKEYPCNHLKYLLEILLEGSAFQLAFDLQWRKAILKEKAIELGFGEIQNPEDFLRVYSVHSNVYVESKKKIYSLQKDDLLKIQKKIIPKFVFPTNINKQDKEEFVVVEKNYSSLNFRLMSAPLTQFGAIKSPISDVKFNNRLSTLTRPEEFLFFSALLQNALSPEHFFSDDQAIVRNPFNLPFYLADILNFDEKITPKKLTPIEIISKEVNATITIDKNSQLLIISIALEIDNAIISSVKTEILGNFLLIEDKIYLVKNVMIIPILNFFKKNKDEILINEKEFDEFKKILLNEFEQSVKVEYTFINRAPQELLEEKVLDEISEHLIYLSESENYILVSPAVKYGETEVSVLSKRNLYVPDQSGNLYLIDRDEKAEFRFKESVREMHPSFEDNPNNTFYYIAKEEFLDSGWFIEAFEIWKEKGYTVLGFKNLKNNNLNQNRIKVKTGVKSGIDWFDIETEVSYGEQSVKLKDIQKSIANKNRFVRLGDGTLGILPEEWIQKFSRYFRSGDIKGDVIRTHKSHFNLIDELFDKEILSREIKNELETYREKLANFHSIRNVQVSKKLKGTLRDYQKEGLNWLHFLDEFGFGGCLADDMGLGKTIQLIAYFLSQIEKGNKQANLVVVPTSLIYNWESEIKKFAPKLNYIIIYGANRQVDSVDFKKYDIIITSYGTMMNDIEILKKQKFNIIVLDESQAIKNPESKRYKAVRLLQARQRIVATGTPVENNTFDLYAQLSFAVPGLLGNQNQFANDYSTPIDRFQDEKRAQELQKKVQPFILRRTKRQVATELPEKTEMIVYCDMKPEQRRIYELYKKEFQEYLNNTSEEELQSSAMHVLQGLTKLRQICNSPALLSDEEYYGDQSAKLEELIFRIQQLQGEHKILVFSQFVTMLDFIKEKLDEEKIKYAYLTGQTRKRQEQVDLFQEDDSVRVFLISLKAGGIGLNLTKAEYVFIVDPWWNPAVENQAIDRAYRIGQENKVIAIRMITPDSIEEKIMELQGRKKKLVEDLIHADSGFFKNLSKEDLLKIV